MKFLLLIPIIFFNHAAMAQDKSAICHLLKQNQSVKSAAYEPGVDAYGRAVAPAGINAPIAIPENIIVPLEADLANRLQGSLATDFNLDASLGNIEISPNSTVAFGEQDITAKTHEWCGTSVPEESTQSVTESTEEPKTEEIPVMEIAEELEVIEVEPKTPILPQEVAEPAAEQYEVISGEEYRDFTGYNE